MARLVRLALGQGSGLVGEGGRQRLLHGGNGLLLAVPEGHQRVSRPWSDLAHDVVATLPRNPERTVALRKLLEGKDAAVRAALAS